MKLKNKRCKDIRCYECPLKTKLCQHFIGHSRINKIGEIIEKMYKSGRLSAIEYRNAKRKAEQDVFV